MKLTVEETKRLMFEVLVAERGERALEGMSSSAKHCFANDYPDLYEDAGGELPEELQARAAKIRRDREAAQTKAAQPVQLRSGRSVSPKSGVVEGQLFTDALADNARDSAAKAMAVDVEAVIKAIEGGETYEDVRRRLVGAYKAMDPAALGKLTERSLIMGELGGRYAMQLDTTDDEDAA